MNVIGLFGEGPNPAACLMIDGEIIAAAEEERFVRVKKASAYQPMNAIKYVMDVGNVSLEDIDKIVVAWDHRKYPKWIKKYNKKHLKNRARIDYLIEENHNLLHDYEYLTYRLRINLGKLGFNTDKYMPPVISVPHHEAHAYSAFYNSGFKEAGVLVLDGSGEEKCTTFWSADEYGISKIDKEFTIPNSLGWMYAAVTEFLGFRGHSDEGKTMGLAPYGKYNQWVIDKLKKIIQYDEKGNYKINPSYIYFNKRTRSTRFTDKFMKEFGEPHISGTPFTELHKDIAYGVQWILEDVVKKLVRQLIKETGYSNICIAGGVGMNCKSNGVVNQMPEVDNLFVFPASTDEGTAIGAAMREFYPDYWESIQPPTNDKLVSTSFGPEFSDEEIESVLNELKLKYRYCRNIYKEVAKKLADGEVVGWFQGRMEFGARALGNRSILADPRGADKKDYINDHVKHREPFRPYCPSLLEEDKDKYLKNAKDAPFMIVAYEAQDGVKDRIPAVVHVDNTVRPQTVNKQVNPLYWNLINEFKKLTGEGILLNTSFNVRGEPIVCKPIEAIRCFYGTGMDSLAIGSYLLEKEK